MNAPEVRVVDRQTNLRTVQRLTASMGVMESNHLYKLEGLARSQTSSRCEVEILECCLNSAVASRPTTNTSRNLTNSTQDPGIAVLKVPSPLDCASASLV